AGDARCAGSGCARASDLARGRRSRPNFLDRPDRERSGRSGPVQTSEQKLLSGYSYLAGLDRLVRTGPVRPVRKTSEQFLLAGLDWPDHSRSGRSKKFGPDLRPRAQSTSARTARARTARITSAGPDQHDLDRSGSAGPA
ncbi:hypothetical protein TIFTF001_055366, partial [Ficus carica]